MSNTPFISIIVPLYNKKKFVKRSLESILSQSYVHFEVLVVNDGSTDKSREVVLTLDDPRIRIIDTPNRGVSSARNRGMQDAKGEFIAFLDADDEWHEKHLEVLFDGFTCYPDAIMVSNALEYRWTRKERNGTEVSGSYMQTLPVIWEKENYLYSLSQGKFPIHICSTMFRRSLLEEKKIGFYEYMKLAEDVNFMLQVSRFGTVMLSCYPGLIYHQDDTQSAMKQKEKTAALVPHYFEKIDAAQWSQEEKKYIEKFLLREYMKKAYQNRHLAFKKEELSVKLGGSELSSGRWILLLYVFIRYLPKNVFSLYKKIKSG